MTVIVAPFVQAAFFRLVAFVKVTRAVTTSAIAAITMSENASKILEKVLMLSGQF